MTKTKKPEMPMPDEQSEGEENMNKANLNYLHDNVVLGVLTVFQENGNESFVYNSNFVNEERMLRQRRLTASEYTLWGSVNRESSVLFSDFENLLTQASRPDVLNRAGIRAQDSKGTRLIKLAKRNVFPAGFYMQYNGRDFGGK